MNMLTGVCVDGGGYSERVYMCAYACLFACVRMYIKLCVDVAGVTYVGANM